jgi:ribonuclease HI
MNSKLIIHTDGGSRGNPGPAAIGAVLTDASGKTLAEISECIGETTNNQAEYRAVIAALAAAKKLNATELEFYLDRELVVKQLKGEYKMKNKDLAPLFAQICQEKFNFKQVSFTHVRRELNKAADALVNQALDRAGF